MTTHQPSREREITTISSSSATKGSFCQDKSGSSNSGDGMCKEKSTVVTPKETNDTSESDEEDGENDEMIGRNNESTSKCCSWMRRNSVISGKELGVWDASLEDQSGCFSRWTLSYLNPLLRLGASKSLEPEDVGVPSKEDLAESAYERTMAEWKIEVARTNAINEKRRAAHQAKLDKCTSDAERENVKPLELQDPAIARALVKAFGVWKVVTALLLYMTSSLLTFVPVLILNSLVRYFETGETNNIHPWLQVAALGVVPVFVSTLDTRHQATMVHCAVFFRTSVSIMLYRKALVVSAAGRSKTSVGQVVNMMSNDTAQLQRFIQFGSMTLSAPIMIIIALSLIYQQIGNATWVGVAYMLALAPVNGMVFKIVSKQRRRVLKYSDLRVKMMNEVLAGIRIIKFYAWERPFKKEVGHLRQKELEALTKLAYTIAIGFSLILMSAPLVQPILVFLTYVEIQNQPLTAATAFTTVALFNIMRFPFAFLPMGFLQFIQSRISLRRLERYLDLPELAEYVMKTRPPSTDSHEIEGTDDAPSSKEGSVTIRNGYFSWTDPDAKPIRDIQEVKVKKERRSSTWRRSSRKASEANAKVEADAINARMLQSLHSAAASEEGSTKVPAITLSDISCTIEAGSLVAVVGEVGSGKSSLLSAILGEMEPIQGSKIYTPQPAGGGGGYVSYCAQTPWVVNDTVRGNILFGREFDQERYDRVVEACALLDDLIVLPAGDMTEIGERGINLSGGQKARVSLARSMYSTETRVMLMDDPLSAVDAHVGEHIFKNAITGELSNGITRILVTHHVHLLSRCDSVIVLENGRIKHQGKYLDLLAAGVDFAGAIDVSKTTNTNEEEIAKEEEAVEDSRADKKEEEPLSEKKQAAMRKSGKNLVAKEEREEGQVAGSAYAQYAKAGGYFTCVACITAAAMGRGAEVGTTFWLAYWSEKGLEAEQQGQTFTAAETNYYVGIYALIGMIGVLGMTVRAIILAVHRLRASKKIHDDITESVMRAPIAFFDVTPTGRILNRFAADMDKLDLELSQSVSQGIATVLNVLGAMAAIIAATKGTFLIPMIPIGYVYYVIQKWFRKTSTATQRLNSVANSPIFTDFSQTLTGTSTIRAYGEEQRFYRKCQASFDTMNASYSLVQLMNSWLGLRLDFLGGMIGAFIGGVAVATTDFIPASWLGLALSYSIEVTNFLKHGVRMIATVEAQMNSVERILYYSNNIEPEAPEIVPEKDPKGEWPLNGEIEIKNASMRYRDGPLVLKDLSLRIKKGEKVGVCGRTGSGKSSLMIALFRIAELEKDGGRIVIDGVNTNEIGTSSLRLNLSIIPQDPIVFSNTVRYNLDPFGASSDKELWDVLKKVQMSEVIAALPEGLDYHVAEGGENFSQGQRQLLCIARSVLRKPKILVMDEATASIDNATDANIQTMIRENFGDATVLTIAHRLNTIMDSDRVLVLDDGRIAEFNTPEALLQKENGMFRSMVEKSRDAKTAGEGWIEE